MEWLTDATRDEIAGKPGGVIRRADVPARIMLHTTEGSRLPAYPFPPHLTVGVGHPESLRYEPAGRVRVWQHVPFDRSSYALLHRPADPETNHMGRAHVQIEVVTRTADHGGAWPDALFETVAGLLADIVEARPDLAGCLDRFPPVWSKSGAWGFDAPQRFGWSEWADPYDGQPFIAAHQHVPGNDHWDAGALDIARLIRVTKQILDPTPVDPEPVGWSARAKVKRLNEIVMSQRWTIVRTRDRLRRLEDRVADLEADTG